MPFKEIDVSQTVKEICDNDNEFASIYTQGKYDVVKIQISFGGYTEEIIECKVREVNSKVFEALKERRVDTEKAIDCASWCELACVGETYDGGSFEITILD